MIASWVDRSRSLRAATTATIAAKAIKAAMGKTSPSRFIGYRRETPPIVFPGQAVEKCLKTVDVTLGQLAPQLAPPHDRDGLRQGGSTPVVKVGCGDFHIPQTRNAKDRFITFRGLEALVQVRVNRNLGGTRIGEHTEDLKHIAADVRALMARHTAVLHKQFEPFFFSRIQST